MRPYSVVALGNCPRLPISTQTDVFWNILYIHTNILFWSRLPLISKVIFLVRKPDIFRIFPNSQCEIFTYRMLNVLQHTLICFMLMSFLSFCYGSWWIWWCRQPFGNNKKRKKIHNKESQEGRKQPKKKLREGYKEGREAQRKDTRTDGRREGQKRIIEIEKNTRNEEHHFLDDRVKKKKSV